MLRHPLLGRFYVRNAVLLYNNKYLPLAICSTLSSGALCCNWPNEPCRCLGRTTLKEQSSKIEKGFRRIQSIDLGFFSGKGFKLILAVFSSVAEEVKMSRSEEVMYEYHTICVNFEAKIEAGAGA